MKEFLKSYASNRKKNMLDEDKEEKKKKIWKITTIKEKTC